MFAILLIPIQICTTILDKSACFPPGKQSGPVLFPVLCCTYDYYHYCYIMCDAWARSFSLSRRWENGEVRRKWFLNKGNTFNNQKERRPPVSWCTCGPTLLQNPNFCPPHCYYDNNSYISKHARKVEQNWSNKNSNNTIQKHNYNCGISFKSFKVPSFYSTH